MEENQETSVIEPLNFWEERYSESDRIWSGRPNAVLVDVACVLVPGTALDLGCGEGADAIWLARRGWQVTGLDISTTAVQRAERAAEAAGLSQERIRFRATDLSSLTDGESFDLVTASFLHSPVELPRSEILQNASRLVAPGGHLLITSHAAFPPWAQSPDRHEHHFLTPAEELAALELDDFAWEVRLAETRAREVSGPGGELATLEDAVVLVRRM